MISPEVNDDPPPSERAASSSGGHSRRGVVHAPCTATCTLPINSSGQRGPHGCLSPNTGKQSYSDPRRRCHGQHGVLMFGQCPRDPDRDPDRDPEKVVSI